MKRVVFKFKDGDGMNLPGDYIEMRDDFIYVFNGEYVVAIVRADIVNIVCISERTTKCSENSK